MNSKRLVVAVTMLVAATAVIAAKKSNAPEAPEGLEPVSFDAAYTMMIDESEIKHASPCMALSKIVGEDAREAKDPVGKRKYEAGAGPAGDSAISMSGDLAAWLQDGVKTVAETAGVKVGGSGPVLVAALRSLELNEEKHDNSVWRGNLTVAVELRDAAGKTCWSGEYWGAGKNWGDPENLVNYQETVNKALDRALADLLKDAAFADALCTKCK